MPVATRHFRQSALAGSPAPHSSHMRFVDMIGLWLVFALHSDQT